MAREFSRKYILILAVAAGAILVIGGVLRPGANTPAVSAQPADSIALQRLSRDWTLRQITDYLGDTVEDLETHVAYLPEFQATGVEWDGHGTFLTTPVIGKDARNITVSTPDSVFILAHEELPRPRERVSRRAPAGTTAEGWVVLVARRPDGQLIWRAGLSGGISPVNCGEASYHEVVFTTQLDAAFAGGAVFDLDGMFLGSVGRCGSRYIAITNSDLVTALRAGDTLEGKLRYRYGIRLSEVDDDAQRILHGARGLWLTELVLDGAAARSGLEIGDVLLSFNDQPLRNIQDLGLVAGPIADPDQVFKVLRAGKTLTVPLLSTGQVLRDDRAATLGGIGLAPATQGLLVGNIASGSPAAKAGLTSGDRIIRVNDLSFPDARQFSRALSDDRVLIVYQREDVQHAVLVSK